MSIATAACGPDSPRSSFESEIVPLLERNCLSASCHGVQAGAEAGGETINWDYFYVRTKADGTVSSVAEAYATTLSRVNTSERAEYSTLLQKPLQPSAGGEQHLGGTQFLSRDSAEYRVLRDWIASESKGGEGEAYEELSDLEKQFAETVLPHFVPLQCMNQACHGRFAPFSTFAQPMLLESEVLFSTEAIKSNYKTAKKHLDFGADVSKSRLIRKVLPLEEGGIPHRGGNDIFFRQGDDAIEAMTAWAEAERKALMGTDAPPEVTGIVFVRGPVSASLPFEHDSFNAGTDLYVLEPPEPDGALRNLTASLHNTPADIRDPAVNHDATKIAFAMRKSSEDALNIYEIGVDGFDLRQLTFDASALPGGGIAANVQPTYGPDGRIYFTSTRAGILADSYDALDTDIWVVEPETGEIERFTFTPSPEVAPSFIGTGKNYGSLAFTMRRTQGDDYQAPIFRTVLDHNKKYHADPEIHVHHGITADTDIVYDMRTMHDGRYACVQLNRDNQWRGGRLAIFDRQFGPEVPRGQEDDAAVGGFRHAYSTIDPTAKAGGVSEGGLYRHPVPLPDGSLLVTHAPGSIDLDDASAAPELGLFIVSIEENRITTEPTLGEMTTLVDEPGIAEYDAEPIVVRPLEDDPTHEHDWDRERTTDTGTLAFRHVETLEAVFTNTEQRGPKPLREDLVYARLIESIPVTPHENTSNPVSATIAGRSKILGEIPLAGGSLYLEVPSDRPFRVQFLNADRMAVGAQQNRWNHVAPGEKFPGGVSPELYPRLCANCHGSLSGDLGEIGGVMPDMISAASMTMATHENLNPRLPLEPTAIGDSIGIDYRQDVLPLLERSCATNACHSNAGSTGGLSLESDGATTFDSSYLALMSYVDGDGSSAFNSELMERILGRELGAPARLRGSCPGSPALSSKEQLAITRWIDLGAVYRGVAE
ncbi:MAG: hypothetical protein GY811_16200 [Myxococcales bacterium]|nr:hypothetical protein [Myxococcales bacterium]